MKVIDLFCGCGGMSMGFQNAGYEILVACDNWKEALHNYQINFDHPTIEIDLSDTENALKELEPYSPDVIIGGPPCQDFSIAGKRQIFEGDGARAQLTINFAEIVTTKKPAWFVMENVPHAKKTHTYNRSAKIFRKAGYALHATNLNASRCGVPQNRNRFFVIGQLYGYDWNLIGLLHRDLSYKPLTIREYFGDLLKGVEHYYHHQRNNHRRAVFSVDEPAPTIRGQHRPKPNHWNYKIHPKDSARIKDAFDFNCKQRALIQTFPQNFKFEGYDTHLNQMIGNAVPVKQAEYIAQTIKPIIEREPHEL